MPSTELVIGFTGTQQGMTASQLEELTDYLARAKVYADIKHLRPVFRHGDCIGADDEAARTARWLGYYIIAHPSTIEKKRAYSNANETLKAKPPLERNRDIVDLSHYMVATPKEEQETLRSGTWATIRYARKCGKPPHIIPP